MAFQIKDFLSVTAAMVNHIRATTTKLTDFNVGSVTRTMIEAPAVEIDELYQQMLHGLVEGIPTAIYRSFDFALIPAVPASGLLRFSVDASHADPIVVPVGTEVSSIGNVAYQTIEALTIPVGQASGEVLATATVPGPAGNALPGTITILMSSAAGVLDVTNPAALSNGRPQETEDERKLRFTEFIKSLARGTVGSLAYAARIGQITDPVSGAILERVARVALTEEAGYVQLYIHNGAGNTSHALVTMVQRLVDGYVDESTGELVAGYRPAGMRVDVLAMAEIPVDVGVSVQVAMLDRTEEMRGQITAALSSVIRATRSGGDLRPVDLVNAVLQVARVLGAEIVAPTLSTACPASAVLVPGTISVAWQ